MRLTVNQRGYAERAGGFEVRLLAGTNQFKCPSCESIVYSRKCRYCGVCGETLPESFLFDEHEMARVKTTLEEERARHRQWMLKQDDHAWNLLPLQ